jgi:hypothetical protein
VCATVFATLLPLFFAAFFRFFPLFCLFLLLFSNAGWDILQQIVYISSQYIFCVAQFMQCVPQPLPLCAAFFPHFWCFFWCFFSRFFATFCQCYMKHTAADILYSLQIHFSAAQFMQCVPQLLPPCATLLLLFCCFFQCCMGHTYYSR